MADRRTLTNNAGSLAELPATDRFYHPGALLIKGSGAAGVPSVSVDTAGRVGIYGDHSGSGAGMLRFLELSVPSAVASMGGGLRVLNQAASDLQVYLAQDNSGYVKLGDGTKELGLYAGILTLNIGGSPTLTIDANYVTLSKPLKFSDGTTQSTAGTGGGATTKEVTVDFGAAPVYSTTVTFADAAATPTSKIMICASGSTASGRDTDELEMDMLLPAAVCKAAGVITLMVMAVPGPITGPYKFNYTLG